MTEFKKNLLDVLTKDRTLPAGFDSWGIKTTNADLTTKHGYRWPFPGNVASQPNMGAGNYSCPRHEGDGLCVALTWAGMASGGMPARTLLLVAYRADDARSDEPGKLRVPNVAVVDLIDGERLVREEGRGANLSRADLSRANLSRADLSRANLSGADLYGANLSRADLYGANLYGADLSRANLSGANLYGANLSDADLYGANLSTSQRGYARAQGALGLGGS